MNCIFIQFQTIIGSFGNLRTYHYLKFRHRSCLKSAVLHTKMLTLAVTDFRDLESTLHIA